MAVVLRLKRLGRAHRPFYRVIATEKSLGTGGKALETLGYYNPFAAENEESVKLNIERVQHWIDLGARPSDTVNSFLRKVDAKWGNPKRKSRKVLQRQRRKAAASK